jgi:O-antigen/teichoic acid export membrane protein
VAISDTQADRKKLLLVAFWLTAILSGVVFTFITFSDNRYPSILNADLLGSWFYLVPITLFLFGLRSILLRYANGQKNYQLISQNSFLQPFATAALAVIFGVIGFQQSGLLLSYTAAFIFSVIFFIWNYKGEFIFSDIRLTKYHYKLAVKYKQFPLLNAPTSILDGVTLALPVFFLAKDYPGAIVAYFALINRVISSPLALVSQSVGQVHLRTVADLIQNSLPVGKYLARLSVTLFLFAFIPLFVLTPVVPDIFAFVFGSDWREAGGILVILMPAIIIRFVVSTLSPVFSSTGNNHLAAIWKVVAFLVTLSVFNSYSGLLEAKELLFWIMITDCALYGIYFCLIWYAILNPRELS